MELGEFIECCIQHQEKFYVRCQINGKWDNYQLSQIPFQQAIDIIIGWYENGNLPEIVD